MFNFSGSKLFPKVNELRTFSLHNPLFHIFITKHWMNTYSKVHTVCIQISRIFRALQNVRNFSIFVTKALSRIEIVCQELKHEFKHTKVLSAMIKKVWFTFRNPLQNVKALFGNKTWNSVGAFAFNIVSAHVVINFCKLIRTCLRI